MGYWRYHPVWMRGSNGGDFLCIIELFMIDGHLSSWMTTPVQVWSTSSDDLAKLLAALQGAVENYKPVQFADLCVGMTFEKISEQTGGRCADPPKP